MDYELLQQNFGEIGIDLILNSIIDDLEFTLQSENLATIKIKNRKVLHLIKMIKENDGS